jgi:hypothetical protein
MPLYHIRYNLAQPAGFLKFGSQSQQLGIHGCQSPAGVRNVPTQCVEIDTLAGIAQGVRHREMRVWRSKNLSVDYIQT